MGVTIAVAQVACDTGIGDQSITTDDLGGLTPKAAYFTVTRGTVNGTAADHAAICIGAATAAAEEWVCAVMCENAQGTMDTYSRATNSECVMILATDGTVDGEADFKEFITNGGTITWGNAPAAAYLLTVVFFAGSDLSAKAVRFTVPDQNLSVDVNTIEFEPDAVLFASTCNPMDDATDAIAMISHGLALNKTVQETYCYGWFSKDASASCEVGANLNTNTPLAQLYAGADASTWRWYTEIGTWDAQGFTITTRTNSAWGDQAGCLALAFNGVVDFEGNIIDSPTGAGDQSVTDPGFLPQFVLLSLSALQAIAGSITGTAGTWGISVFDADDEYCNSVQDEDAQGVSDTQSMSDDTAINLPQDDGTAGWVASLVRPNAEGWKWNFTTTQGTAVKWWYLAIERARQPRYGFTNFQIPGVV